MRREKNTETKTYGREKESMSDMVKQQRWKQDSEI